MYLIRLDDACCNMNETNWLRMEQLLDNYSIQPIVGIIPNNKDQELLLYNTVPNFWERVQSWMNKGWTIALHGDTHVYETDSGGINPINKRSEFAGVSLERQREKIRSGNSVLLNHGINAEIFFAPSHTFDLNTLQALKDETDIRVISDTIANDVYFEDSFYFIPQQSGAVRNLPFKLTTFCYHPNTMLDADFEKLNAFLNQYSDRFTSFSMNLLKKRRLTLYDKMLRIIYFIRK